MKKKQRAKFVGAVAAGVLSEFVRRQVAAFIAGLPDGDIVLDVAVKSQQRTLSQNNGYHAMLDPWAEHLGYTVDELKLECLGITFGWRDSALGEHRTPLKPHTSGLSVEEFSRLFEHTALIAAGMGFQLVLPSEYAEGRWEHRKTA